MGETRNNHNEPEVNAMAEYMIRLKMQKILEERQKNDCYEPTIMSCDEYLKKLNSPETVANYGGLKNYKKAIRKFKRRQVYLKIKSYIRYGILPTIVRIIAIIAAIILGISWLF